MGIKKIHILLIVLSCVLALFFGVWAIGHKYSIEGGCSLVIAVGLFVYAILFLKKMKDL